MVSPARSSGSVLIRLAVHGTRMQFADAPAIDNHCGLAKHLAGGRIEQSRTMQHADIVIGGYVGCQRCDRQ